MAHSSTLSFEEHSLTKLPAEEQHTCISLIPSDDDTKNMNRKRKLTDQPDFNSAFSCGEWKEKYFENIDTSQSSVFNARISEQKEEEKFFATTTSNLHLFVEQTKCDSTYPEEDLNLFYPAEGIPNIDCVSQETSKWLLPSNTVTSDKRATEISSYLSSFNQPFHHTLSASSSYHHNSSNLKETSHLSVSTDENGEVIDLTDSPDTYQELLEIKRPENYDVLFDNGTNFNTNMLSEDQPNTLASNSFHSPQDTLSPTFDNLQGRNAMADCSSNSNDLRRPIQQHQSLQQRIYFDDKQNHNEPLKGAHVCETSQNTISAFQQASVEGNAMFQTNTESEKRLYMENIKEQITTQLENENVTTSANYQGIKERKTKENELKVNLANGELWHKFFDIGTEMIITKAGRRMFPAIKLNVKGLKPHLHYIMAVDVVPLDNNRYRYVYHSSQWMAAGTTDACPTPRTYIHPDSPSRGDVWMRRPITFDKLKLTNYEMNQKGHVILSSMHKYQPRIHIIECRENFPINIAKLVPQNRRIDDVARDDLTTIIFQECCFTTVTAYQNQQITKLKIDRNPFAKGFRDTNKQWRPKSNFDKLGSSNNIGEDRWTEENHAPTTSGFSSDSNLEPLPLFAYCGSVRESAISQGDITLQSKLSATTPHNNIPNFMDSLDIEDSKQLSASKSAPSFHSFYSTLSQSYPLSAYDAQPCESTQLAVPTNHSQENETESKTTESSNNAVAMQTILNEYFPFGENLANQTDIVPSTQSFT